MYNAVDATAKSTMDTICRACNSSANHILPDRIMIYCHDLFGLGNIKRMLHYCQHLRSAYPHADMLFCMGSPQINLFDLPERFEYIKLPEISRGLTGMVSARTLAMGAPGIAAFRAALLRETVEAFQPDLFIIDKKPLGAMDELASALCASPEGCARVLVCRDILDAPARTRAEMARSGFHRSIRTYIDQIQVVGDRHLFDFAAAYDLPPDVAAKVVYAGYLAPQEEQQPRTRLLTSLGLKAERKTLLAMVGGGEDGVSVLDHALTFAERHPSGPQLVALCGPQLPASAYQMLLDRARASSHVCLLRESADVASLVAASDAVISMAGYNSVCAILAAGKPCILLPRREPSHEQLVRAELLSQRGIATCLSWRCTADELATAVNVALAPSATRPSAIRFNRACTTRRIASGISGALDAVRGKMERAVSCSA